MKVISLAIMVLSIQLFSHAQNVIVKYFKTAAPLSITKLVRKNNVYQFSSEKWQPVTNKEVWPDLFAVENEKIWTGQKVKSIRIAGYWAISTKAFGYLYAADVETEEGEYAPGIFISSFNTETNRKGIDIDPFSQAPSPTGMKGKVVITQTLLATSTGLLTITNKHQSSAKVLTKTAKYKIGEDGAVEVQ